MMILLSARRKSDEPKRLLRLLLLLYTLTMSYAIHFTRFLRKTAICGELPDRASDLLAGQEADSALKSFFYSTSSSRHSLRLSCQNFYLH